MFKAQLRISCQLNILITFQKLLCESTNWLKLWRLCKPWLDVADETLRRNAEGTDTNVWNGGHNFDTAIFHDATCFHIFNLGSIIADIDHFNEILALIFHVSYLWYHIYEFIAIFIGVILIEPISTLPIEYIRGSFLNACIGVVIS